MFGGSNRPSAKDLANGGVESNTARVLLQLGAELFLDRRGGHFAYHLGLRSVAFFSLSLTALYRLPVRLDHLPTRLPNYRSFFHHPHSSPLSAPFG